MKGRLPKAVIPQGPRELIAQNVQAAASLLRIAQGVNMLEFEDRGILPGNEEMELDETRRAVERLANTLDPNDKFLVRYGQG